jgi:hypothetical protein
MHGYGFKTCRSCGEKDPSSAWRERHTLVLCVGCNLDHDRLAERHFIVGTAALRFKLAEVR